jgi:multidrug efflux pump subunit AcrB
VPEGTSIEATTIRGQESRTLAQTQLETHSSRLTSGRVRPGSSFHGTRVARPRLCQSCRAHPPDAHAREELKHRLRAAISEGLVPEASVRVTQLVFGPYTPFPVEFRIMGPDQEELYKISEQALRS